MAFWPEYNIVNVLVFEIDDNYDAKIPDFVERVRQCDKNALKRYREILLAVNDMMAALKALDDNPAAAGLGLAAVIVPEIALFYAEYFIVANALQRILDALGVRYKLRRERREYGEVADEYLRHLACLRAFAEKPESIAQRPECRDTVIKMLGDVAKKVIVNIDCGDAGVKTLLDRLRDSN